MLNNFAVDDRVRIVNTKSFCDGHTGTVLGVNVNGMVRFYCHV